MKTLPRKRATDPVASEEFRRLVAEIPELTFGYIGNVGPHGDNRTYHLWVNNVRMTTGMYAGNMESIWSASVENLNVLNLAKMQGVVRVFKLGQKSRDN